MEQRWNLDLLFKSFTEDSFKEQLTLIENKIDQFKIWADENFTNRDGENITNRDGAVGKLEDYLNKRNEFIETFSRVSSFAGLHLSTNVKNSEARKIQDRLELKMTELTEPEVQFLKWLSKFENIEEISNSSEVLKTHSYYLKRAHESTKYLLTDKEEIVLSKLKNTGSNAWSKLIRNVTSTLKVDIELDGKQTQMPLPVVRNLAYDSDAAKRRIAYDAELKSYEKIEDSAVACLNGIKGEVITECDMRGHKSVLHSTLFNSKMEEKTLNAMLQAMKEYLPEFHKYFRKKAELLGHESKGLPFYEMFAPVGKVDMTFTFEEARDFIVKNFGTFSQDLADMAKTAFDDNWIDADPREGKVGGAFCANLRVIKQSRILANYNGSFSNMTTLAHELGHAYHGQCLNDETYLNCRYPMPLAETASIFCETIITDAALKDATSEQSKIILENVISAAAQVIVDIYSRYLFETRFIEKRKNGTLNSEETKELMLQAQKEAYGDGLDPEYLHPYMWACKPHYYYASANFYNFPYAFGLLFAKGLYAEYIQKKDSFPNEYVKLLAESGKNSVEDVAASAGIDIGSVDFWRNSLEIIKQDIHKFLET